MIKMPVNTTRGQDMVIHTASHCFGSDYMVNDLISVIHDLDQQISDWKHAANCETPKELSENLTNLQDGMT